MTPQRISMKTVGLLLGWGLFVLISVRLFDVGFSLLAQQEKDLVQMQEQLRRLRGWLAVEGKLIQRREELVGSSTPEQGKRDRSWRSVENLQKLSQDNGVSIVELRPSWIPGQNGQARRLRLDLQVEGQVDRIGKLLQNLPQVIPGIHLESLQMIPRESGGVQGLFRIDLSEGGG